MLREYKDSYKLYASQKTIAWTHDLKLPKSLTEYTWKNRTLFAEKFSMGDKGRIKFYRAHIYRLSMIIDELLEIESEDTQSIKNILGKISVAWITKEQQKELDRQGRKTKQGDEPLSFCAKRLKDEFLFLKEVSNDPNTDDETH